MTTLKKTAILIFLLSFNVIFAQAPQKMSYQAIIRNASGGLVTNSQVGIKISILKGTITGNTVYVETQNTTTDVNGLVSVEIGGGSSVSGNFAAINWGNDSYFIKTETDPDGGSNYTITGTSQLLSVPYALYAENTKPAGKSTVYIRDDITNAEAQIQIAEEVGPSTEYIYITDTTLVVTVNLDAATSLISLTVTNNSALTTLTVNGLKKAYDQIAINNNPSLNTLNFNSLKNAKGISISTNPVQAVNFPTLQKAVITIGSMNSTTTINLPQLTVGGLNIYSIPNLTALNVPNFTNGNVYIAQTNLSSLLLPSFTSGYLQVVVNQNLTSISAPNYNNAGTSASFIGGYSGVIIENNATLTSIALPNLTICYGKVQIKGNAALLTVSLPTLQYVTTDMIVNDNQALTNMSTPGLLVSNIYYSGTSLTTVDFSSLNTGGLIEISNTGIQNLNFPALVNARFNIVNNPQLITIGIPNLSTVLGNYNAFSTNHLPSSEVNSILNKMLTVLPASGKDIYLKQSPAAPPTGQGIIDKATLISTGNTVRTD